MNTELQLQIQAYLDNELPSSEARKVAGMISNDLEAQELYRALKDTREIVSTNELPAQLQEPRDFYFSQIQRRIAAAEAAQPKEAQKYSWWIRMVMPFAGAAALLAVVLMTLNNGTGLKTALNPITQTDSDQIAASSSLNEFENQSEEVGSITYRNEAEGITVVWLTDKNGE
jgi:negative regulator of sigma E activity